MIDKNVKIHDKAIVEDDVSLGEGTRVWAFTHIMSNVEVGKNCNICDFAYIESGVKIGNEVTVKSGIYLWEGAVIEDNVFLGPNVVFTNDLHPRSRIPSNTGSILIRKGASVGANTVIVCGNEIGKYAMVGAGSVVTKDVASYGLVYGNPAKLRGFVCECAKNLSFDDAGNASCSCGLSYGKKGNLVSPK